MLALLASWLVITLVALALGNIILDVLGKVVSHKSETTLPELFFSGLCVAALVASLFSLFIPLSFYLLVAFVAFAVVYWLFNLPQLIGLFRNAMTQLANLSLIFKFIFSLLFLSILIYGLTTPLLYDEGLYHLQAMKWAEEYQVIPGLGNLHGRFAFNSSFLLLSTLFNYHPSYYTAFFSLNSLSLFVFCSWLLFKIKENEHFVGKISLSALLILSIVLFAGHLSSTSTDILANILVMYIMLNFVLYKKLDTQKLMFLGLLAIFCTTLKLSSGIVCMVSLYAFYILLKSKNYTSAAFFVGFGLLILTPWIIRFVLLSGYLLYPFPSIDIFSFDWKMPIADVIAEKNAAYAWPRIPEANADEVLAMPFYVWIPIWIKNQSLFTLFLYGFALKSTFVMLINIKRIKIDAIYYIAWFIIFIGLMAGFFTAPDPRFSIGFILMASIIPLLLFGKRYNYSFFTRLKPAVPLVLLLGFIFLSYSAARQVMQYQPKGESLVNLALFPQSIDIKKDEMSPQFGSFTKDKIQFYYPTKNNQCYDMCLPCMPYQDERIQLRGSELHDGLKKITK